MNEQDELNEKIFGKEINDKRNAFNKAVEELEQEYADYFKNRKSHLENEEYDKIGNHFTISYWNGRESFAINNDSDINEIIMKKLMDIYKENSPIYY